ncbi:hypothetical protein SAMN05660350_00017 [Geodermatophilus obscurus]|uniref:Uncharacterized protein n=1 Tax=Geodermatophilus obscurus TaxID=1861 RepID=A0A1M7RRV8_9ACTN|nr:hypothetical protein SAMN05660350_00017 [Geodermatophilus obscurus]
MPYVLPPANDTVAIIDRLGFVAWRSTRESEMVQCGNSFDLVHGAE